jgi:tRNA A-37 threonylcarbamoyl transferase component Bud32
LVTANESGFTTLSHYLREKTAEKDWIALRGHAFLKELAWQVGRMHDKGMVHYDLKGSNILVREEGEGWAFLFTDLKASRFMNLTEGQKAGGVAGRRRDIIRLLAALRCFFSAEERRGFLCAYLPSAKGERERLLSKWEAESLKQFPS